MDALIARRSLDCGQSWSVDLASAIDADSVLLPHGPSPVPATNLDRPELHITQGAFECAFLSVGASRFEGGPDPVASGLALLQSLDRGLTWSHVATLDAWPPAVMTSTPAGRIYLFSCLGNTPKIAWSQLGPGGHPGPFQIADVWPASSPVPQPERECSLLDSTNEALNLNPGRLRNQLYNTGVAFVHATQRSDVLRVLYPVLRPHWNYQQEARVVTLELLWQPSGGPRTNVLAIHSVRSEYVEGSVLFPALVEPDRLGGLDDADPLRDAALLTWADVYRAITGPAHVVQRAQAVTGVLDWSMPFDVSLRAGARHTWEPSDAVLSCLPWDSNNPASRPHCWAGDYHYSSFLGKQGNALKFFVVWPEPNPAVAVPNLEVNANVVTVWRIPK
jgi:hypothetical protein